MSMTVRRIIAKNTASETENKIHDDATAKRLGFDAGLVPGMTLFAHMCREPLEEFGSSWLAGGTTGCRFMLPVYDGEEVAIEANRMRVDSRVRLALTLRNADGLVCATAHAEVPATRPVPPGLETFPAAPMPDSPPPASEDVLASTTAIGSLWAVFDAGEVAEYLSLIGEETPRDAGEPVAHPGWLLAFANMILMSNFTLGPWIHTASEVEMFDVVRGGEPLSVRGRVARAFERKGHRMIELDILAVASDRPVARIRHEAIIEPRSLRI